MKLYAAAIILTIPLSSLNPSCPQGLRGLKTGTPWWLFPLNPIMKNYQFPFNELIF